MTFHEIDQDKNKLALRQRVRGWPAEVAQERLTGPTIPKLEFYGRQGDKDKIMKFLLSKERDSDSLSVYPIVGIGGMGKTTLSQMVYNDDRVSSHFNPTIWICVSENFSVERILCSIVKSITKETKYDALGLEVVERKVQDLLQSKRFFLVLDDVWNRNEEMRFGLTEAKWNHLKSVLSCGSKGASILVSTRDMDVATIMATGTFPTHRLQGLSEDDCWLLLKQHAFGANREERAELVAIAKEIAKKCGGSPLAARALGGLLHLKDEGNEWREVLNSRLWSLQDERCILPALRLSYYDLNPISRQCFAFCAMFPKDTVINKDDLIYLWMANGFISSTENKEVEDVGSTIWKELCRKSFFEDICINDKGQTSFKMHDLVHDLAESVLGKECVTLKNADTSLQANTHHVFVDNDGYRQLSFKKGTLGKVKSLRTIYELEPPYRFEKYACLPTHPSLRVLQISSFKSSSLGSLIHLRYLKLHNIEIKTLPNSIYSLRKLEILKLKYLDELKCLPKHLTRLKYLRHLVIVGCHSLSLTCPNIGKLSSLRTLSVYIVSTEKGHTLAELHDLRLGGDMHIKGLENVGNLFEAQSANLKAKRDLHKLQLSWGHSEETRSYTTNPDQVLEALQPHSKLKKLIIDGYAGLKPPSWIGMLSRLVDLELGNCSKCVQLPSLGKLPSLRTLRLYRVDEVQYMDDDESYDGVEVIAFLSLEELVLNSLPKLERLLKVKRGEMFPRLRSLEVEHCPKLELSSLGKLPSLKILKLDHVNVEYMDDESDDGVEVIAFPSLEELVLNSLPKLERLLKVERGEMFPRLRSLEVTACPELELPSCIPSLTSLKLNMYTNELLRSVSGSTALTSLVLDYGKEGLTSFPVGTLTCLQTLNISYMDGMKELPDELFNNLNALKNLNISNCYYLECLPEQGWEGLRSLQKLRMHCLGKLKELPDELFNNLNTLKNLEISYCGELECLPEQGWEGLCSLQTIYMLSLYKLKELPDQLFNNLNALEKLVIDCCGELKCLPEQGWEGLRSLRTLSLYGCSGLRSLPDGVRHLTSLETLIIGQNPALKKRCEKGRGKDWDKIAHVPEVLIY